MMSTVSCLLYVRNDNSLGGWEGGGEGTLSLTGILIIIPF